VAAAEEALLAPSVTRRLIAAFTGPRRAEPPTVRVPGIDELTARELEVLELLAEGLSNAEIGVRLFVGEATVKTRVARILTKLGVRDRVQAVIGLPRRDRPGRPGEVGLARRDQRRPAVGSR
jgi:DNA-binding NarL/FixJ family response regulator